MFESIHRTCRTSYVNITAGLKVTWLTWLTWLLHTPTHPPTYPPTHTPTPASHPATNAHLDEISLDLDRKLFSQIGDVILGVFWEVWQPHKTKLLSCKCKKILRVHS